MFVRTEDEQIINLDFYARIRCYSAGEKHEIHASTKPSLRGDSGGYEICIARFEKEEQVDAAFDNLFDAMRKNRPIWDAKAFKREFGQPPLDIGKIAEEVMGE